MPRRGKEPIPSEPFAKWLNERVKHWEDRLNYGGISIDQPTSVRCGALHRVCAEVGWTGDTWDAPLRRLYRMRRGLSESRVGKNKALGFRGTTVVAHTDWFERSVVEEALHHAGVLFADMYPDIAAREDVELEPEAWCPGCREERLPINGQCPFCEWRIGPETGQTLMGRLLVRVAA